jgi:hypothetical protein
LAPARETDRAARRRVLRIEVSRTLLDKFVAVGVLAEHSRRDNAAVEDALATLCVEALKARALLVLA